VNLIIENSIQIKATRNMLYIEYTEVLMKKSQTCGIMNLLVRRQTAGKVQYMRRGMEVTG